MAAKILKGSNEIALGDFRGEIEILRRVHHPNAVQVGHCRGLYCCGQGPAALWRGRRPMQLIVQASHQPTVGACQDLLPCIKPVCPFPTFRLQFLGACTKKEPYILVTELMSGGSLADAFRRPQARGGGEVGRVVPAPPAQQSGLCAGLLPSSSC